MKIRYYLRGLGLGILVTAVFFLLGGNSKQTMSDEMIKERAKELGMVESTVLADMSVSTEETQKTEEEIEETEEAAESSQSESLEAETESVMPEETTEVETALEIVTEEETVSEEEAVSEEELSKETAPTGQMISIVVNKGEGSDTVSQRLHDAGLVDDPYEYDRYLMQNGYDKRISAGEHMVPAGADWQEIATILTSK